MRPWRRRESWLPRRRGSARRDVLALLALVGLAVSPLSGGGPHAEAIARYARRRVYREKPGPRMLIITLAGATWADFRRSEMRQLARLMERGAAGLMPVASRSDSDPGRSCVSLGAGRAAAGGPTVGKLRRGPGGTLEADTASILEANRLAQTGAEPGLLGSELHQHGLSTNLVLGRALLRDPDGPIPEAAILMDSQGRLGAGSGAAPGGSATRLDRRALTRTLKAALDRYDVVLLDLSGPHRSTQPDLPDSPAALAADPEREAALRTADGIVGDAMAALAGQEALIAVLSPIAPPHGDHFANRSLAPVVIYQTRGRSAQGLLYAHSTRWPGIVTAADFAPTVLAWWQIKTRGLNPPLEARPGSLQQLDRLDRFLTDRYRLRVLAGQCYVAYGLLVVVIAAALARAGPGRWRSLAGPALGLALVPVGLSAAAPVPPGHDAWYLLVAGLTALGIGLLGARAGRSPAQGLAAAMLLGAALIVSDVLNGSPLMRFSALEMGVMTGSRFYGIGNEYMGALVGMTVIGLGAWLQAAPQRAKLAWALGAFAALVIGAPFWGANWGGSLTATTGLVVLWLLSAPRIARRHIIAGGGLLLVSVGLPAALDLMGPPSGRSHIGASAAALLAGEGGPFLDTLQRKLVMSARVLRAAPWSLIAAAIAAAVLWALLRRNAPARRALAGQRALTAGLASALIAGVVAMLANDSGVAAGFGAVLAALAATVFLAARAPEV